MKNKVNQLFRAPDFMNYFVKLMNAFFSRKTGLKKCGNLAIFQLFRSLREIENVTQMSEVVDITDETEASDAICASSSRLEKALLAIRRIDED